MHERLTGATPGREQHGTRLDLQRLLPELSPRQRRLLRLSFWLGLDARELSRVLGGAVAAGVKAPAHAVVGPSA